MTSQTPTPDASNNTSTENDNIETVAKADVKVIMEEAKKEIIRETFRKYLLRQMKDKNFYAICEDPAFAHIALNIEE